MIDHAWLQVSYMAQIIVACLLFMIPVAKRRRFPRTIRFMHHCSANDRLYVRRRRHGT